MSGMDDFYEPDEPIEDVLRAFDEGEKFVTTPPSRGQNRLMLVNSGRTVAPESYSRAQTKADVLLLDRAA